MVEDNLRQYENLTALKSYCMHEAAIHLPLTILPINLISPHHYLVPRHPENTPFEIILYIPK